MATKTSNRDHNLDLMAVVRGAYKSYQAGLTSEKELASAIKVVAERPISFVYAVGQARGAELTYGTVDVVNLETDPALLITSRCGDELRVDKGALLTFKDAIITAIKLIEDKYPTVGQL